MHACSSKQHQVELVGIVARISTIPGRSHVRATGFSLVDPIAEQAAAQARADEAAALEKQRADEAHAALEAAEGGDKKKKAKAAAAAAAAALGALHNTGSCRASAALLSPPQGGARSPTFSTYPVGPRTAGRGECGKGDRGGLGHSGG